MFVEPLMMMAYLLMRLNWNKTFPNSNYSLEIVYDIWVSTVLCVTNKSVIFYFFVTYSPIALTFCRYIISLCILNPINFNFNAWLVLRLDILKRKQNMALFVFVNVEHIAYFMEFEVKCCRNNFKVTNIENWKKDLIDCCKRNKSFFMYFMICRVNFTYFYCVWYVCKCNR